jgi:WD40 repeat protein
MAFAVPPSYAISQARKKIASPENAAMLFDSLGAGLLDLLILLFFGSNYSNDLLAAVDADGYFKSRRVAVSVATMIERASQRPADAKSSVAQLLAVRWLGEHPDQVRAEPKARALLEQLAQGKAAQDAAGFAREYAERALAKLDGKSHIRLLPAGSVPNDALAWFPDPATVAGAFDLRRPSDAMLPEARFLKIFREQQARVRAPEEIYELAERVGNLRLDRVSFVIESIDMSKRWPEFKWVVRFTGLANSGWLAAYLQSQLEKDTGEKATVKAERRSAGERVTVVTLGEMALGIVGATDVVIGTTELLQKTLDTRATGKNAVASGRLKPLLERVSPRCHALLAADFPEDVYGPLRDWEKFMLPPHQFTLEMKQDEDSHLRFHAKFDSADDAEGFAREVRELKEDGLRTLSAWRDAESTPVARSPYIEMLRVLKSAEINRDDKSVRIGVQVSRQTREAMEKYLADKYLSAHRDRDATAPRPAEAPARTSVVASAPRAGPEAKGGRVDSYGDPLPEGAVARLGSRRLRHDGPVESIAFAPDGKTFVAADASRFQEESGTVRLWDAATGRQIRVYAKGVLGFHEARFSSDGKAVAAVQGDDTIYLWEAASGRELHRFPGIHDPRVGPTPRRIAFSPDGRTLAAAGGLDRNIRLWDVATGNQVRSWPARGWVHSIAFSPDGQTVATSGRFVRTWETNSGKEVNLYEVGPAGARSVRFSPDGRTLIAASFYDDSVRIFEVDTAKVVRRWKKSEAQPGPVALSPDGKLLAALSIRTVHLRDVATGNEIRSFSVGDRSLCFSPDGKRLVTGSYSGEIMLFDVATGDEIRPVAGHRNDVLTIAYSPDGRILASGSGGAAPTIQLWEMAAGKPLRDLPGSGAWVQSLVFSPDGKTLASGSQDNLVHLWDVASGRHLRECRGHRSWAFSVAFSPDGQTLASVGQYDGTLRLWEAGTGKELRVITSPQDNNGIFCVEFSPDSRTVAAGYRYSSVLWDRASGNEVRRWKGVNLADHFLLFTPDGRAIVAGAGGEARLLGLWEIASGKELRTFPGEREATRALALSPDGKLLAAHDNHNRTRIWEIAAGKELCQLPSAEKSVHCLAFSPDGRHLATGSQDTTILIWDVRECSRRGR